MDVSDPGQVVSWRLRSDLIRREHEHGGWILNDPVTLQHTFLEDHEYLAAGLLDGIRTLKQWHAELQARYSSFVIEPGELIRFLDRLIRQRLVISTQVGGSGLLRAATGTSSGMKPLKLLAGLLRIQIPLVNPSRFLTRVVPCLSFLFTRSTAAALGGLFLLAAGLITLRFDSFRHGIPDLATFADRQNLPLIIATFVLVKCIHEIGHAVACRHFGADCSECGVMFLIGAPVLYTNVSESWKLPRHQRLIVSAAGILVELAIASVCVILWWFAVPGFTRTLLMNTLLLCSVTTLLFNANPLLRFDGYFLLSDYAGIPNLYQQSSLLISHWVRRNVMGLTDVPCAAPSKRTRFLAIYGTLALMYRLVITVAIVGLVLQFSEQFHQRVLGQFVAGLVITMFIALPLWGFLRSALSSGMRQKHNFRVAVRCCGAAAIICAGMLVRWPHSIVVPCMFLPLGDAVYVNAPGNLADFAEYGSTLSETQLVAQLTDADLEAAVMNVASELRQKQIALETLKTTRTSRSGPDLDTAAEAIEEIRSRLASLQRQQQQLKIAAHRSGVLIPPQPRTTQEFGDRLSSWDDVPMQFRNRGAFLERGTLLGYIGNPSQVRIVAFADESQAEFLTAGRRLKVLAQSGTGQTVSTCVEDVSRITAGEVPKHITLAGLNRWQNTLDADGYPVRRVTAVLDANDSDMAPIFYGVGLARIEGPGQSAFHRIRRYLTHTFPGIFR